MQHSLEFIFHPEVQAILDHFCGLLGVRIAFFTPAGKETQVGKNQSICAYCRILRSKLGYDEMCSTLDASVRQKAAKSGALQSYTCHGGMVEAVMPLVVSGRLIGFIMIGQFRQRAIPPANIQRKAPAALRSKLTRAFTLTPRLTPSQVGHALGIFELLVRHIAEKRLVNVNDAIQKVLDQLRDAPESRLCLQEAASLAGCSPAAFSRLFQKTVGLSYGQKRIQLLIEKADALFKENPGIQIQEVAFRLGFDDPLYFSRLYRKKRGMRAKDAVRPASA